MTLNESQYISLESRVFVYDAINWFSRWVAALWHNKDGSLLAFTFVRRPPPGRERNYQDCFPIEVQDPWLFVALGKPDKILGPNETDEFLAELSTREVVVNAES